MCPDTGTSGAAEQKIEINMLGSAGQASWGGLDTDAPHSFILWLRLVYQISNEDNKGCGAGVFMRPYLEFSPRQQQDCHSHRRVTRLDLVKVVQG